jgi:hypothetical protein
MIDTCSAENRKAFFKFAKTFPKEISYLLKILGVCLIIVSIGFSAAVFFWTYNKMQSVEVDAITTLTQ